MSGAALGAVALPGTFPQYLAAIQAMHLGGAALFAVKFAIAWPVVYHLCNGLRHLVCI